MLKLKLKFFFASVCFSSPPRSIFLDGRSLAHTQGQYFSGGNIRIYLLGNPILWWSNLAFLAIFLLTYLVALVSHQRNINRQALSAANSTDDELTSEYNQFFFCRIAKTHIKERARDHNNSRNSSTFPSLTSRNSIVLLFTPRPTTSSH